MNIQKHVPLISLVLAIFLLLGLVVSFISTPRSGPPNQVPRSGPPNQVPRSGAKSNEGFSFPRGVRSISVGEFSSDGIVVLGDSTGGKLSTLSIYDVAYPPGTILLWNDKDSSSASAPPGWALCDGNNGTPDMSNRFPLGWDINNNTNRPIIGTKSTGGAETVPLTVEQMPSHTHTLQLHKKDSTNRCDEEYSRKDPPDIWNWSDNMVTSEAGGNEEHPNMPPYRVMKFIMKL